MSVPKPNFQVLSFRVDEEFGRKELQPRHYHLRKAHSKSRSGCLGCKVKRVKCDEGKPTCRRCQRNQGLCIYRYPRAQSPHSEMMISQDAHISSLLQSSGQPDVSAMGASRAALLNHFCSRSEEIFGIGGDRPDGIISLGLARPYLLEVILAISACHMRHHTESSATYRVAEHFRQAQALQGFQSALSRPFDQQGADALLLTAMLLNFLSFSLPGEADDADICTSWVFRTNGDQLGWMALNMGFKPLILATAAFRQDSILKWMYEGSDDESHRFSSPGPLVNVPSSWKTFFGLDGDHADPDSIFYEPVRILAIARSLRPAPEEFLRYVSFFGKLDVEFRVLVEAQDERAIWLLGYWFGLMSRYDLWWMRVRARRDHKAAVQWLRMRGEAKSNCDVDIWCQLIHDLERAPLWETDDSNSLYDSNSL